jgi:NAD(P)H-flavin reductase
MRSLGQSPPVSSQAGLKDTLQKQNYFLACQCYPEHDMTLAFPDQSLVLLEVSVIKKQVLSADIVRLVLRYQGQFDFFAGQYINLQRPDGLTRSYSIANIPDADNTLELHIRRLPNGQFSSWVHDELETGTRLTLSEARGTCHYLPGKADQPLLLMGTGSGLAPLYGIITDALTQAHSGNIHLFHGSRDINGLYLMDELRELAERFEHFTYTPCLSGQGDTPEFFKGRVNDVALATLQNLTGWRVYLCGHPEMVNQTQKMAYLKGASLNDIYTDAFHVLQTDVSNGGEL